MHDHDDDGTPASTCRVGDHPHRDTGAVCDRHLTQIRDHLTGVARMTRQLTYHLVPGATQSGDKVTAKRIGAPTPVNDAVLTLVGPGTTEIRRDRRAHAPMVRRWSTTHTVDVTVIRDDHPVTVPRTIRTWHREIVCAPGTRRPVLVPDDDQIGIVPPAEWADLWVRRWRLALGHTTTPIHGQVALACDTDRARRLYQATTAAQLHAATGHATLMPAVTAYLYLRACYYQLEAERHHRIRNAILGIGTAVPPNPAHRRPDPVTAELQLRYGAATTAAAVEVDTVYLAKMLTDAAEHPDTDVDTFTTELRALHAELEHALGETNDDQWLGRCPTTLTDPNGNATDRRCGQGLWQDPYRHRIQCPRCQTAWDAKQWRTLAVQIRYAWPIDTRRRYTLDDRQAAEHNLDRIPRCKGCNKPMAVEWRDVASRRDKTRMYRPVRLACPDGCLAGGTTIAA